MITIRTSFAALALLLASAFTELSASEMTLFPLSQEFVEAIQSLPSRGILRQKPSNGTIYLDLTDDYLNLLEPFFPDYTEPNLVEQGAHISVMRFKLHIDGERFDDIEELGQEFSFDVVGVARCAPASGTRKQVWFLVVHAPELSELRIKYGLTPYLQGTHAFHITERIENW